MDQINIPTVSSKVDPSIRKAFDAIRSALVQTQTNTSASFRAALEGMAGENGTVISTGAQGSIPPKPGDFTATGAFNSIMLAWDDYGYRYLAYAIVYRSTTPNFADAQRVGSTVSSLYADTPSDSSLAVTYYYWVRLVSTANVKGPLSDMAAASTANDPSYVLELLSNRITASHLHYTLTSRIEGLEQATDEARLLLDTAGDAILQNVLAQRASTEALYREQVDRAQDVIAARTEAANELLAESQSLTTKIADEATARAVALAAEASARTEGFAAEAAARSQAIIDEALARGYAVQEAKDATSTLAITLLGADGTSYNSGLIHDERYARTTETSALAQSISLLSAGVDGGFDPADRWDFDADLMGWQASGCSLSWSGGWIVQSGVSAIPARVYLTGLSVQGSKYATVKFRLKRVAGSGWGVSVDYELGNSGTWTTGKAAVSQTAMAGDAIVCTVDFSDVTDWKAGTITGIRINTGESTSDAWEFDWIMTGRQSPGVSTAQLAEEKAALVDLISAEVTARELLDAKLYGADGTATSSGTIYNERAARVSAEGVINQSIENLEAQIYDPAVGAVAQSQAFQGVYNTVTDSSTGVEATASKVGLLAAEVHGEDGTGGMVAQIASLQTASASGVEAIASDVNTLFAGFNEAGDAMLQGALGMDALQGTFAALIQQEAFARADADGAEAEQRELLRAKIDDVEAGVLLEQTARVTALEAEATNRVIMGAQIADSMSALEQAQSVTASAVEATASSVNELAARVGDATAALLDEQLVRATQDAALAQSITTLTADLDNTAAMVQAEALARADADSAEASNRLALAAIVDANTAAITREETVRAEGDQSILSTVDIYGVTVGEAALQTALAGEAATGVMAAYIKQTRDAIASTDLARAEQINYLQAQINDNFSGLLEERKVTTSLVNSVASAVDSLVAQFDGNLAALQQELITQASAIGAEVVARETLSADFVSTTAELDAAIQNESTVRANALQAEAEQRALLASQVDNNLALVQQMYYTKSDTDQVVASARELLAAEISGNTAAISTEQMVRATSTGKTWVNTDSYLVGDVVVKDGSLYQAKVDNVNVMPPSAGTWQPVTANLYAQHVVKTDVNGKVAGFGLANDGEGSLFEIAVDRFGIHAPPPAWSSAKTYVPQMRVLHGGKTYKAKAGSTNIAPPNATYWEEYTYLIPFIVDGEWGGAVMDTAFIRDLTSTNIRAKGIAADRIDAVVLSAITADLGTVNAGTVNGVNINGSTITGSVVRTAASGKRVIIDSASNDMKFYSSSGELRASLGEVDYGDNNFATLYVKPDTSSGHKGIVSEGDIETYQNLACLGGHIEVWPEIPSFRYHMLMNPVGTVGAPTQSDVANPMPGMLAVTQWTAAGTGAQTGLYFYGYVDGVAAWRRII